MYSDVHPQKKINEKMSLNLSHARVSHCELLKSEAFEVAATIVIYAVLCR